MPINVCDKDGKHIGVVHKRYLYSGICTVALTDIKANELKVDIDKMKGYVAAEYGCKKMFGKIQDDELREKLFGLLRNKSNISIRYEDLIKVVFLRDIREKRVEDFINDSVLENRIKGYVLYDFNKLDFKQNSIVIHEDIEYIERQVENDWDRSAIFAKITDYPILETSSYRIKLEKIYEYTTKIKIVSGNYEDELKLSTILSCKKDMGISFVTSEKKIDKAFCDGRIYVFKT